MENLEKILEGHSFLAGMDPKHVEFITGCASNVSFKAGEFIIREGEDANAFYLIRHGKVMIETFVPQKGPVLIRTRDAGEVLGWSWLVPPYKWHFDARALEVTRAIALDAECLRKKCDEDHDFGYEIMKRFTAIIAERLEATRLQLMDIYGKEAKK